MASRRFPNINNWPHPRPPSFAQNTSTEGTLNVTDGTHSASLTLLGQFMNAFHTAPDASGHGTLVTYQPEQQSSLLAVSHT